MKYKNLDDFLNQKSLSAEEFAMFQDFIDFMRERERRNEILIRETEKEMTEAKRLDLKESVEQIFKSISSITSAVERIQNSIRETQSTLEKMKKNNFEKNWNMVFQNSKN